MSKMIKIITGCVCALFTTITFIGCEPDEGDKDLTYQWPNSTLEEANIDTEIFADALSVIEARDDLYSFLLVRHGKLVNESYMNGWTRQQRIHVRSITKSVVSAMVGVALQESFIDSVQEPLSSYLSEDYMNKIPADKYGITIQNFLTMTSGIEWSENGAIQNDWYDSIDRFEFVLDLPMDNTPGEVYEYNTAAAHVLSGIITYASHKWLNDLAETYLFEPLGIGGFSWKKAPEGLNMGGFGLYLTPRDMARFGQLYLEDGVIDGTRIFPEDWVAESFKPRETNLGYGYLWWIKTLGPYSGYAAEGADGQMIYLIPDYNLIIVFTGQIVSNAVSLLDGIVRYDVMPAIKGD